MKYIIRSFNNIYNSIILVEDDYMIKENEINLSDAPSDIPIPFKIIDGEYVSCDPPIIETEFTEEILKQMVSEKYSQISQTCEDAIHAGFQLETTAGVETFSLEEQDQTNLLTAYNAIQNGRTKYAYHANKTLCRIYTSDEIKAIGDSATAHKLYHTTYVNHLFRWLDRVTTKEELDQIYYGADLPEDLAENMQNILTEMSEDSTVTLNEETRIYSINTTP